MDRFWRWAFKTIYGRIIPLGEQISSDMDLGFGPVKGSREIVRLGKAPRRKLRRRRIGDNAAPAGTLLLVHLGRAVH